ncbi:radical SAM protein [Porphyromonas levii]|uniref:radical SAM protein n=1 Tax=Porphyromonas levii TaxID=28114 RepID=UPI003F9EBDFD
MRKNKYLIEKDISPGVHLCYNAFNNSFLFLNERRKGLMAQNDYDLLFSEDPSFYEHLTKNDFIVDENLNEYDIIQDTKRRLQYNSSLCHVMVNTTLDCNLNCWYCYEVRKPDTRLSTDVIEGINKYIQLEYKKSRYNVLKVSFFGGEPFVDFHGIKQILDSAQLFAMSNNIQLIADFTTNATLITPDIISYLSNFHCVFQITLDGDRRVHNKIKIDKNRPNWDTYQATIDVLKLIEKHIENRYVAVRINFSNATLKRIDEIINDIDFLNRKYTYVILKKVWQIDKGKVDKKLLFNAINKLFDKNFLVDYYIMPKGSVCFAERNREVLFNYDGRVFKCSTISEFNDENSLGSFNLGTGEVTWDKSKKAEWLKDLTQEKCKQCKWYPVCLGPCNRQLIAHKAKDICTFDAMNMDTTDYLLYSYRYHRLKIELEKESNQM